MWVLGTSQPERGLAGIGKESSFLKTFLAYGLSLQLLSPPGYRADNPAAVFQASNRISPTQKNNSQRLLRPKRVSQEAFLVPQSIK